MVNVYLLWKKTNDNTIAMIELQLRVKNNVKTNEEWLTSERERKDKSRLATNKTTIKGVFPLQTKNMFVPVERVYSVNTLV